MTMMAASSRLSKRCYFSFHQIARRHSSSSSSSFKTFKTLTLAVADEIASLAVQTASSPPIEKPIAVCILNSMGQTVVTKRMDDCPPTAVFSKMAHDKAWTALSMQMSTRAYGAKYLLPNDSTASPDQFCRFLNQVASQEGKAIGFPGGILLLENNAQEKEEKVILGAVGVSGASGDEDEYIAMKAVQLCSIASQLKVIGGT